MIIIHVDYDSNALVEGTKWPLFEEEVLLNMRDVVEGVAGKVFQREQTEIEVRIRPFGQFDEFDETILFTAELLGERPHNNEKDIMNDFEYSIITMLASLFSIVPSYKSIVKYGYVYSTNR